MKDVFFIICVFFLAVPVRIQAQETEIKDYLDRSGAAVLLYTGKEEWKSPFLIRGHPYLDTDEYREGELMFAGRIYPGVRVRLNTYTDELSILSPLHNGIIVPSDRIEYARFPEYTIIYNRQFPSDEVKAGSALPPGYYARITTKNHAVYRREIRDLVTKSENLQSEWVFNIRSRLYIYKDGIYHSVGSKGSVLKLFRDRRRELNRYASQERLNFRDDRVNSIVALVGYYESMTENQ